MAPFGFPQVCAISCACVQVDMVETESSMTGSTVGSMGHGVLSLAAEGRRWLGQLQRSTGISGVYKKT